MLAFELPVEELRGFSLPCVCEPDFETFWDETLERSRSQPLDPDVEEVEYPVKTLSVKKASFSAYDGGRICAWLISLRKSKRQPTLVCFHGYSGDKGRVFDYLGWALQGYTVLALDVRSQSGESSDLAEYHHGHTPGYITKGILDPREYYFVRAYADCVRALDFISSRDEADPDRIGVTGGSQGGGLSLAAAALDPRPKMCAADVPGFCHFQRTLELTHEPPWTELVFYFQRQPEHVEQAFKTLSYVELNNFAHRITCPTLISVGMQDMLCPPSTIFSVYNKLDCEKEIAVYPYNGHEGGGSHHQERKLVWINKYLKGDG